jgi:tetraacyldisaccharide-1-P 4'-kinase
VRLKKPNSIERLVALAVPLLAWKPTRPEELLCTEKDAVKLWPHFPQAWAVPLHCQLPEDLLAQLLVDVQGLSSRHG